MISQTLMEPSSEAEAAKLDSTATQLTQATCPRMVIRAGPGIFNSQTLTEQSLEPDTNKSWGMSACGDDPKIYHWNMIIIYM